MTLHIWKFYVKEGCEDKFVRMNTVDWPDLFGRSPEYRGTRILRSDDRTNVYLTIDSWTSRSAFDAFVGEYRSNFDSLCSLHRELYETEEHIGFYESDDLCT